MLTSLDMLTSTLQSITLSYAIYRCRETNQKIDKIKLFAIFPIFLFASAFFMEVFGDSFGIDIFLIHILSLCAVIAFYKKNAINALIAFTIVYIIIGITFFIFGILVFECAQRMFPKEDIYYRIIFLIYLPQYIILLFCLKCMKAIKKIYKVIINEGVFISFLIISFSIDFIVFFYFLSLGKYNQLVKNTLYIMFFMFLVSVLVYFWKINKKSEYIYKLNEALEIKNGDLRKIKHDYGAQISYLYGLCLMKRFDDLKKSLTDITNNNEAVSTAVEVTQNKKSLISIALKPAIEQGIHLIVEEKCDLDLININEMDLYKVISYIVNSTISIMKGKGIIIAKSYKYLGNIVIKIDNNGPKIEESCLSSIFKGFTTKDNIEKSNGYGLIRAKELIEYYQGEFYIKSTEISTEFKIILPMK